jgi:hypothetical protein
MVFIVKHARDLGDHVTATLDFHPVADLHAQPLYLVHVVEAEMACLFNPFFDKGIAQSVFGVRLGKIRAFDDETIFAHFFGL